MLKWQSELYPISLCFFFKFCLLGTSNSIEKLAAHIYFVNNF
jgi:hypothetical protein